MLRHVWLAGLARLRRPATEMPPHIRILRGAMSVQNATVYVVEDDPEVRESSHW